MRHLCYLTRHNLLTKTPKQKTSAIVWFEQRYLLFRFV